jgi:hypothetical protein
VPACNRNRNRNLHSSIRADNISTTTPADAPPPISVLTPHRPPDERDRCQSTLAHPHRHAIDDRPTFFHPLLFIKAPAPSTAAPSTSPFALPAPSARSHWRSLVAPFLPAQVDCTEAALTPCLRARLPAPRFNYPAPPDTLNLLGSWRPARRVAEGTQGRAAASAPAGCRKGVVLCQAFSS